MPTTEERIAAFRTLHEAEEPLLLPNAWDYTSAAALAGAGYAAIGTTSLGVAAAHGLPDGEGRGRAHTVALTGLLRGLPSLLTVDIEAGFSSEPAEVAELVAELLALGAVGVNLEDGRPGGTLADPGQQAELIAAVKERTPSLFMNARVDTHWLAAGDPPPLADTIGRAERYLAVGADGIFVPGPLEDADIRTLVEAIPAPLNVLYLPGRQSLGELADLGVRRVSTGSLLFRAALHATVGTVRAIRDGEPVPTELPGYAEIQRLSS